MGSGLSRLKETKCFFHDDITLKGHKWVIYLLNKLLDAQLD